METEQEIFNKLASKIIYEHKSEFDDLIPTRKLSAVKLLKDYSRGGLKECKDVIDLYCIGGLVPYIKYHRKEKLDNLSKIPLIDTLIVKIKTLKDKKLKLVLQSMSIDELMNIDKLID